MSEIVIFDFETGGLEPKHPNIQLAAIAVDQEWNELDAFNSKISFNPAECEAKALELNHFDGNAWHDAPRSEDVFAEFAAFLKKHATMEMTSKRTGNPYRVARIAAYNAIFDKDRLWEMADGQFVPAHPMAMCIMQRAMWWVLEVGGTVANMKLGTIAAALGIPSDGAHDALCDVRIAAEIAKRIGNNPGTANLQMKEVSL